MVIKQRPTPTELPASDIQLLLVKSVPETAAEPLNPLPGIADCASTVDQSMLSIALSAMVTARCTVVS